MSIMQTSLLTNEFDANTLPQGNGAGRVEPLKSSEYAEVLSYLEARPVYTAYLSGMIRDNGLQSPLNRGTFYGYRNQVGELEGVALIGHATLLETSTDRAIQAFALTAQRSQNLHMIMCEENRLDKFWSYYAS